SATRQARGGCRLPHQTQLFSPPMNGAVTELSLEPLGAGDLIDRAVRLYRRHFWTLLRIAAPPVLVSALGWTIATIFGRALSTASSDLLLLYILLLLVGCAIVFAGALFSIIVMGGA